MKKKIAVFLFDGFSDWEISYLTPEINKSELFELVYFSPSGDLVTSMGGLQVKPTKSLKDLAFEDLEMLILPGGTAWDKGGNREIEKLTVDMFEAGKPVAAICAATIYLGQIGLLNDLKHTSSDLNYLKGMAPEYSGGDHYQNALAVTDGHLITANGIAPIEFAREIFKTIGLYSDAAIEKWFQLFKNGVWSE
ncbi:type 1 glutamine amidotransferase family protein [Geofilum rubicundum]|uniref:ThiJ/PfpI family n=1 Tax=Geofilum rubicundum JCM 15548 TaxID=1236989 RepID=A0A0E9LWJ6_9BACT|nr:type 1 glutamine amidotransferase family protein [Geofilum rubicundum]GAO29937.1 ThiJ/PfpI family [Geofilum rubicundum JCM 15548]